MINQVTLVGRTGKDAEVKYIASGTAVANVSVATTEKWKKDGQAKERTEWHNVTFWGNLAEIAGEYLKKGTLVYVQGKLQYDEWEKDGQKHRGVKVVADKMQMLSSKGEAKPKTYTEDDLPPGFEKASPPKDSDLPF